MYIAKVVKMQKGRAVKNALVVCIISILLGITLVPIVNTGNIYIDSIPNTNDITQISGNGDTLYVGGTGPINYSKIQDAIDNASNGDTVFVYDDSSPYYENVVVNKSINLKGENRDTTVIDGNGSDVVYVSADWVNISAFTLRNGGFGINIHSDYNTISGNNISNNWYGIFLDDSSNTISGNNISSNGIYLYHSSNNNISDNSFFNDGLFVYYSYQNNVYNNTVNGKTLVYLEEKSNKVIKDAGQIVLINCNNIIVQNQELSNTRIGVQLWSSDNCLIFGNNISSNNVVGIHLYYSSNNIISDNIISDSDGGIFLYSSSNNNISSNKIFNNSRYGIKTDGSDYNSISINDISNNDEGIRLTGSCYNEISGNNIISNKEGVILHHWSSHNNTISGNNIISNHYGIWTPGGSNNTIFGNNIISNDYGIDLESPLNVIKYNNFMGNSRDAIFMTFHFPSNYWYRNYWDDWPSLIPRPIFGMVILSFYPPLGIPWMNFDWCPLTEPYGGE